MQARLVEANAVQGRTDDVGNDYLEESRRRGAMPSPVVI